MRHFFCQLAFPCALLVAGPAWAEEVDYHRDIKPLFATKCAACHGPLAQEAGLRLDAGRLIHAGSEEGPVITPGAAPLSRLLERVRAADPAERMPPEGEGEPLTREQIDLLTRWIETGAAYPADETILPRPEEHWAYQVPQCPTVPTVSHPHGAGNPIDAFIAERYEQQGLSPVAPADRRTLLRRVTFDLIGLPPTPGELSAFLADDSDAAWERVVDRLLESPQYGERWGRHWMDVWRYSDWNGYKNELRGSQRHIWRWRDWIVESLNSDLGYDEMVRQMLAGDELAPEELDTLRATGFLARSFHVSNRNIWLDAVVEHTAKAFLGMTINCARCHDHKFDPIAQRDYYAFRAIFEPYQIRTQRLPGQANLEKQGLARVFDAQLDAPTYLYLRGDEKHPDKDHPVPPGLPGVFDLPLEIEPVSLPLLATRPSLVDFIEAEDLAAAKRALAQARANLKKTEAEHAAVDVQPVSVEGNDERPPSPPLSLSVPLALQVARAQVAQAEAALDSLSARWAAEKAKCGLSSQSDSSALAQAASRAEHEYKQQSAELAVLQAQQSLHQAESSQESDAAARQQALAKASGQLAAAEKELQTALESPAKEHTTYTPIGESYPSTSTGRRLALARWITFPGNPLTARVAVNHIWLRHFGEPLVENVFDFGLRSPRPVHADLLDWLAVELMEQGWSMKHLHRLIVTSRTYQLASSGDSAALAANQQVDPDNRYLWRANVGRLDAESVRDSLLAVSGRMDLEQGGPDIDFADGETVMRRSLYFRSAYEKQMPLLLLFDTANPDECYRRSESIIPQQALALANSSLSLASARETARLLSETSTGEAAFIDAAFERLLSRPPTADERAACLDFLARMTDRLAHPDELTPISIDEESASVVVNNAARRAREILVHTLLNHNDFVSVR